MNITTKTDLENLILNQIEENLGLDYKSAESLGKSVGKKKNFQKMFLHLLIQMVELSFMELKNLTKLTKDIFLKRLTQ